MNVKLYVITVNSWLLLKYKQKKLNDVDIHIEKHYCKFYKKKMIAQDVLRRQ